MRNIVVLFLVLFMCTMCVYGQQDTPTDIKYPRMFPGSISSSNGLFSPFEDSVISRNYLEQGWTMFRGKRSSLVPFASIEYLTDERGYDWNNKVVSQFGLKGIQTFDSGVIQIGAAYVREYRTNSKRTASQWSGFVNYWFGWQNLAYGSREKSLFSSFPGSSWGSIGNISPVEKGNIIGMVYMRQGVVLTRIGTVALVPFADLLFKKDTDKFDWNNGHIWGVGGSAQLPLKVGILEAGIAYKKELRYVSGNVADGMVWFINFWAGWNPAFR